MTNETRTSTCSGCTGALTWAGHYWVHAHGSRLCGQACGVCGQRFVGTHVAHYAAAHLNGGK
jgi:hypothetical protein